MTTSNRIAPYVQLNLPTPWTRGYGGEWEVAPGVTCVRNVMVNYCFVAGASSRRGGYAGWVLIDAGLPGSAGQIRAAAERHFGPGARPEAILLTHGHFDHVGGLPQLAEEWDVPVFAHELELPYLTGRAGYAPPDPFVGGMMSLTSPLYPRGPIDLGDRVQPLPPAGSVPFLPEWRVIETPGHSPGHVSFFRDTDRTLIAGDAFVTTKQESLLAVLSQAQRVFGPPRYFTHDWAQAEQSVRALAQLDPQVAATGHGTPMSGPLLREQLHALAADFERRAVPHDGRYAHHPVRYDARGPRHVPPRETIPTRAWLMAGAAAVGIATAVTLYAQRDRKSASPLGRRKISPAGSVSRSIDGLLTSIWPGRGD